MDNTPKLLPDQLNFDNQIRGLFVQDFMVCYQANSQSSDIRIERHTNKSITLKIYIPHHKDKYTSVCTLHLSVKDLRALVSSVELPRKATK